MGSQVSFFWAIALPVHKVSEGSTSDLSPLYCQPQTHCILGSTLEGAVVEPTELKGHYWRDLARIPETGCILRDLGN